MNYWITTDTHFGHADMHDFCNRPVGFEDIIFKQLKYHVRENDVLIHLGDVCIENDRYWNSKFLKSVQCKKWLILGNHDRKSLSWYISQGWDSVCSQMMISFFGHDILLSHKPVADGDHTLNIHGHHHNTGHHPEDQKDDRQELVHIEDEFKPFSLKRIVERFNKRKAQVENELGN